MVGRLLDHGRGAYDKQAHARLLGGARHQSKGGSQRGHHQYQRYDQAHPSKRAHLGAHGFRLAGAEHTESEQRAGRYRPYRGL